MYYGLIAPYIFEACLLVERISSQDLSDVRVPNWLISAISVFHLHSSTYYGILWVKKG